MEKRSDAEEFLIHYGVKGMKWGVNSKGRSSSKKPRTPGAKRKAEAAALKQLSTKELKKRVERGRLEAEHKKHFGKKAAFASGTAAAFITTLLVNQGKEGIKNAFKNGTFQKKAALGLKFIDGLGNKKKFLPAQYRPMG